MKTQLVVVPLSEPKNRACDSLGVERERVLLVEDSDDDAFLFERAVRQSGFKVDVTWAATGMKAKDLLNDGPAPSLIVLDCNMHGIGGLELLQYLRSNPLYARTPIVMLSGTHVDSDVEMAYAYGGNSFVAKPDDYHEYMDRVIMLLAYWLGMNTTSLPNPFADIPFRDEGLRPPTTWREAAALAGAR